MTDIYLFYRRVLKSCKTRLIDEVLGQDSGDKVPMEKVVMLIWQFREDPQVVRFMTRFVAKVSENLEITHQFDLFISSYPNGLVCSLVLRLASCI